jgi:hypothetical protein
MYLIVLEGGGDIEVKIVSKAAWDYIHSDRPPALCSGSKTALYEEVPPEVVEGTDREAMCRVTVGSCENDRALWVPGVFACDDVGEARQYASDTEWSIEGEWHGGIY